MIVVEDSRNKVGKHKNINAYMESVGVRVLRHAMIVGDYTLPADQRTCIDSKKDMVEVSQNIFQDHKRFRAECELAKDCEIHLIVLIEDNTVGSWEDLLKWTNPQPNRSALTPNGERCYKVMKAMEYTYGVEFQFCKKKDTGKRILEILTGERSNMRRKDGELLEDRRPWPFTVKRRDRCVKRIMEETGIGKYEAEIAYRIATLGLSVKEVNGNDGMDT